MQSKKLKRAYKVAVAEHNLNPENWMLKSDENAYITITNRETGSIRKINKFPCKKITSVLLAFAMSTVSVLPVQAKKNDTIISENARNACVEYGNLYGICPELLMAIIERESSGNADAVNGLCIGLMQVSEKWHAERAERLGVENLYSEQGNILVAADYLSELCEKYKDVAAALMVYHGERDAIEKSNAGKISSYANWILNRSAELEKIHEDQETSK